MVNVGKYSMHAASGYDDVLPNKTSIKCGHLTQQSHFDLYLAVFSEKEIHEEIKGSFC